MSYRPIFVTRFLSQNRIRCIDHEQRVRAVDQLDCHVDQPFANKVGLNHEWLLPVIEKQFFGYDRDTRKIWSDDDVIINHATEGAVSLAFHVTVFAAMLFRHLDQKVKIVFGNIGFLFDDIICSGSHTFNEIVCQFDGIIQIVVVNDDVIGGCGNVECEFVVFNTTANAVGVVTAVAHSGGTFFGSGRDANNIDVKDVGMMLFHISDAGRVDDIQIDRQQVTDADAVRVVVIQRYVGHVFETLKGHGVNKVVCRLVWSSGFACGI